MARDTDKQILQGHFSYPDYAAAELGRIEQERIARLEKQLNYDKPKVVCALYKKAMENRVFQTPEGVAFLYKLRQYLTEHTEELGGEDIPGIPAELLMSEDKAALAAAEAKLSAATEQKKAYRARAQILGIVVAFLAAAVIGMLVVAGMSDSPNILNYEKALQNRYAEWQEELEERESELRERERELERPAETSKKP